MLWELQENTFLNKQQPIKLFHLLISRASSFTHILCTSTLSQPSMFDPCEAPPHTHAMQPCPLGCWRPSLSLSSLVSTWPTSLVPTSAMTSFHRWCHGRFAPLKGLLFLHPSSLLFTHPVASLPVLTYLFPTTMSLTPSSPAGYTPSLPVFHKPHTSLSNKGMWSCHLSNQPVTPSSSHACDSFSQWGHLLSNFQFQFLIVLPARLYSLCSTMAL